MSHSYLELRRKAQEYLTEYKELVAVTIRRAVDPPKPRYKSAGSESYKRMPETCPRVRELVEEMLPLGSEITSGIRDDIFNAYQTQISSVWRERFDEVLAEKHIAIRELKRLRDRITAVLDEIEGIDYEEVEKKGNEAASKTLIIPLEEEEADDF